MTLNFDTIRYRGDERDMRELLDTYRVESYLDTYDARQRQENVSIREKFLRDGIQLNKRLSPRIHGIYEEISETLNLEEHAEIFCFTDSHINAYAVLDRGGEQGMLIGITSEALEKLDDEEIKFIIGHELGHFIFGNHRFSALIKEDGGTVLPSLGEILFMRWKKKQEISADRVGLLACGEFTSAARALLKSHFNLSEKNIRLDIEGLMEQLEEIKGSPELMKAEFHSHPLLPIRLKALELFSKSKKAQANGILPQGDLLGEDELEDAVDRLMALTHRYPAKPLDEAVMKVITLAGIQLLSSDQSVDQEEVKHIYQFLYENFTDEPEQEIVTDLEEVARQLPLYIDRINNEGDLRHKMFILSRLADIGLADGALLNVEGAVLFDIAKMLNIPEKTAYEIIVEATRQGGMQVDPKLNNMAEAIRKSFSRLKKKK